MYYRIDLVFSYWIFAWFLLYYFGIIDYNPKLILIFAFIENIFIFIAMIMNKTPLIQLLKFLFINFFIKILPLWYVWRTKIMFNDIYPTILLCILYLIWVYINKKNVIHYQLSITRSLINGKSETPLLSLIKSIHNL